MNIRSLIVKNFRNHRDSKVEFGPEVNLIVGRNGSGKTTLLEAITVCSLTKSFQQVVDNALVTNGEDSYFLQADVHNLRGIDYWVKVHYKDKKKVISNIKASALSPKDLIGELPAVSLNPDDKEITSGSPSCRRSFMDKILSQSHRPYLEELLRLKKIVKQRNHLLGEFKRTGRLDAGIFEPLSNMLAYSSAAIVKRRLAFLEEFARLFEDFYRIVSGSDETVAITYDSNDLKNPYEGDANEKYLQKIMEREQGEKQRGMTLAGAQRDDLDISINGAPAKTNASQGQHKSLIIALKFAEFELLKKMTGVSPVILLDDIFSELDDARAASVLQIVQNCRTQTFITMTDPENFVRFMPGNLDYKIIRIDKGRQVL